MYSITETSFFWLKETRLLFKVTLDHFAVPPLSKRSLWINDLILTIKISEKVSQNILLYLELL